MGAVFCTLLSSFVQPSERRQAVIHPLLDQDRSGVGFSRSLSSDNVDALPDQILDRQRDSARLINSKRCQGRIIWEGSARLPIIQDQHVLHGLSRLDEARAGAGRPTQARRSSR